MNYSSWEVWLTSTRLLPSLCMPRKMDDDIRSPFAKRYEYKEHSSYHSFRLNDVLIIQNIFSFFYRSRERAGAYGKLGNLEPGINRALGETTTESATT